VCFFRPALNPSIEGTRLDGRTGPANVQAVWFGERPYIITAEGNRYYKGAILDNGWTVKDIADGRILLAKDGETLALVVRQ
jgi:hypothetical protein